MKKSVIVFFLASIVSFSFSGPAAASIQQHQVMLGVNSKLTSVNGEVQFLKNPPFIVDGTTMVPLRFVSTAFLCQVNWDSTSKTATITKGTFEIKISPGNSYATVNDYQVPLRASAQVKEDTTFVPLRFLSDVIGAQIKWNEQNKSINITMREYRHDKIGISFNYPAGLVLQSVDEESVCFTGAGEKALKIEKITSPDATILLAKKKYPKTQILLQSEQELWISKGNLTVLYKLISADKNNILITYGVASDQLEPSGRNDYALVTGTLNTGL